MCKVSLIAHSPGLFPPMYPCAPHCRYISCTTEDSLFTGTGSPSSASPTTEVGEAEDNTPAPAASVYEDSVDFTPTPASGGGGSGTCVTTPPSVFAGSGEFEETPSPNGNSEARLANGAAGADSGTAAGALALSSAVELLIYIAM